MTLKDFVEEINKKLGERYADNVAVKQNHLNSIIGRFMGESNISSLHSFWIEKGTVYKIYHADVIIKSKRKQLRLSSNPSTYNRIVVESDPNNFMDKEMSEIIAYCKSCEAEEREKEKEKRAEQVKIFDAILKKHSLSVEDFKSIRSEWEKLEPSVQRIYL